MDNKFLNDEEEKKKEEANKIYFERIFNQSKEAWNEAYKKKIENKILKKHLTKEVIKDTIYAASGFDYFVKLLTDEIFRDRNQFDLKEFHNSKPYKEFKEKVDQLGDLSQLSSKEIKELFMEGINLLFKAAEDQQRGKLVQNLMKQDIKDIQKNAQKINALGATADEKKIKQECLNQLELIKETLPLEEQKKFNDEVIATLSDKSADEILKTTKAVQNGFISGTDAFMKDKKLDKSFASRLQNSSEDLSHAALSGARSDNFESPFQFPRQDKSNTKANDIPAPPLESTETKKKEPPKRR